MADEIRIRLDLDRLTIGDLEALERAGSTGRFSDLIEVLDRVVDGGVRHLPASSLSVILQRLNEEIQALANPGT